ncbi:hypothetical protein [Micromonospora rhizosphaerae]|nr:hypothetical protein [Micromonospora rhizosphaerae]
MEPVFYLACTPYVLAYGIRAARPAAPQPAGVTPSHPVPSGA